MGKAALKGRLSVNYCLPADALRQKGRLKWISCFLSRYYLPRHVAQFRERPERLFWTQSCHGQMDSALHRRNNTPKFVPMIEKIALTVL